MYDDGTVSYGSDMRRKTQKTIQAEDRNGARQEKHPEMAGNCRELNGTEIKLFGKIFLKVKHLTVAAKRNQDGSC